MSRWIRSHSARAMQENVVVVIFFFLYALCDGRIGDWAVSSVGRMRLSYTLRDKAIKMRSWVRAPGGPSFLMSRRLGFAPGSTAHETNGNLRLVIQQHLHACLLILRGLVAMTGPCHQQIRPRPGFNSRRGSLHFWACFRFFTTQVFLLSICSTSCSA